MLKAYCNSLGCNLKIEGHADYAPKGQDIVCAAVSILAQTLSEELSEYHGYSFSKTEDIVIISCNPPTSRLHDVVQKFRFAERGLALLAAKYPDNVQLYLPDIRE